MATHPDGRLCKKCAKPMRYRLGWHRSRKNGPKYLKNRYDCTFCYRKPRLKISWIRTCKQCHTIFLGSLRKVFCSQKCLSAANRPEYQPKLTQRSLLPLPCPKCGSEGSKYPDKRIVRNGKTMSGNCKECDKAEVREYRVRWKEENPEAHAQKLEELYQWKRDNPDRVKEAQRRIKAEHNDRLPPAEWLRLKHGWHSRCAYCGIFESDLPVGRSSAEDNLHQDHVIPRSKGGRATWDNILPACFACNTTKSNMPVAEFLA